MKNKVPPEDAGDVEKVQPGYLGETPPPGQIPARGRRTWVDKPAQLVQAVEQMKHAAVVAVDAEFTQVRSRSDATASSHRLALLQLAIDGQCFIVDALRLQDLTPLNQVTNNPSIIILLHGAGADLRVMSERSLNVAFYYDLEATSRSIFGQHESSLASMLQRAFGVRLDKSLQRTDWTRRPLPPAMMAYAARDAEMTLALYYWLKQHFAWALELHSSANQQEPVPEWIEPLLRGSTGLPAELAVAEAIKQGLVQNQQQVVDDMRNTLQKLTHPMRRSRLLRLIADLSLLQLAPDVEPLLHASTADERAAAVRTLGRLYTTQSKESIAQLLTDPVYEVRRAAQTALRAGSPREAHGPVSTPARGADGSRSWSVGETAESMPSGDDDWRSRLRSLMDE